METEIEHDEPIRVGRIFEIFANAVEVACYMGLTDLDEIVIERSPLLRINPSKGLKALKERKLPTQLKELRIADFHSTWSLGSALTVFMAGDIPMDQRHGCHSHCFTREGLPPARQVHLQSSQVMQPAQVGPMLLAGTDWD